MASFLKEAKLETELKELSTIERKLRERTTHSCKHASFCARSLLEGLADRLFPAQDEPRKGRNNVEHQLGPEQYKNRLIAYVEDHLGGQVEGEEFRSFTGTMDLVFRWTGKNPHGTYKPEEAEHLYTRMIEALSVIARSHAMEAG